MSNQDSKNFVDNVLNAQKQVVDTVVENTKKLANGNAMVNDTIEKGSEWYNNWLEKQKTIFSQTSEKTAAAGEKAKDGMSKMSEFYQNWFGTQMNMAKQMWETSASAMKNASSNNSADMMNPMAQWTNWMNNMQNMNNATNWMNQGNNWMNQMQNMNPFNMDAMKKANENSTNIFNQYYELLNNNFAEMQKNFAAGSTAQDAYGNMVNVTEGFTRFYEMWSPLWKSIQEKSFNMDMYKQWANPVQYKDLMDKYFGFMPENARQYMQNMGNMMQDNMKQMGGNGMNGFQQMRGMMSNMPGMNGSEIFGNMLNGYNAFYNNMSNAVAPLAKMITPNQQTKTMMEWNDISNRMMVYNIKNSELQYMIYNQGSKVMDKLAENIMSKIEKGEEYNSMMALYQEWLNISDKNFVSLFETEEYGKLMAEVSSLQMKLRKDIEMQMEKMFANVPVATRSEMDEMYKTIYDLKKQVRQLEKMMEMESEDEIVEEKPARKTASKK
ncbi:MAG: poly(R)-hydroxyalkanoic acid synthase subunit PhaE [Bacteroidota bacterium]